MKSDEARALARTTRAVACWRKRARKLGGLDPQDIQIRHRRVLAWLIANHLVQAWYRRSGLDVLPFSIGDMYGYGMRIARCNCRQARRMREDRDLSWVACGSVRVDRQDGGGRYHVTDRLAEGQDPLAIILEAAEFALCEQIPGRCTSRSCAHRYDAHVYLDIYQVITMLLARGVIHDAILGDDVHRTISGWNVPWEIPHPLLQAGIVAQEGFTGEYFVISVKPGECAWIGRRRGDLLVLGDREPIEFEDWCGGEAERGEDYLERRLGKIRMRGY